MERVGQVGRFRESLAERRFPNRLTVGSGYNVSTMPPTRSKPAESRRSARVTRTRERAREAVDEIGLGQGKRWGGAVCGEFRAATGKFAPDCMVEIAGCG